MAELDKRPGEGKRASAAANLVRKIDVIYAGIWRSYKTTRCTPSLLEGSEQQDQSDKRMAYGFRDSNTFLKIRRPSRKAAMNQ